jgi:hypothetical protein
MQKLPAKMLWTGRARYTREPMRDSRDYFLRCPRCYGRRIILLFDGPTDPQPGKLDVCARCLSFYRIPFGIDLKRVTADVLCDMADLGDVLSLPDEERASVLRVETMMRVIAHAKMRRTRRRK